MFSALHQYSVLDYVSWFHGLALVGVSMPIFWLGMMLVNLFAVNLGWLPPLGRGSLDVGLWDFVSHMILPCACLATIPMATFARITRSSMLKSFITIPSRPLRARGISERSVIWKHALKNALPPIVTVLGLQIAGCFTGAILTESIFSWPGMGTMIVNAITNRDYMLIQGVVLFFAWCSSLSTWWWTLFTCSSIPESVMKAVAANEERRGKRRRPLRIRWAPLPTRSCCVVSAGPTAPGAS